MRRRHLLLAAGLCAAIVGALLLRPRSENPRPAARDELPAAGARERQAGLAAVEPAAEPTRTALGSSRFEMSMAPDGRLVRKGAEISPIRLNRAALRAGSAPVLRILDERGAIVPVTTESFSIRPMGAEDSEKFLRLRVDREDLPARITVPFRKSTTSVVLPRTHVIRVRVESPAGAPIPFAQVFWFFEEREYPVAYADEDGRCTLTRLGPTDVVSVSARPPAGVSPPAVSAEFTAAGDADQDLVLIVEPESAGDLFVVRLADAPELRGAPAVLVREPGGGVVARCSVSDAFTCWFPHVPSAGTYTLWIAGRGPESPCVYATGLRPSAREPTVRAQPAYSLRIRPLARGRPTGLRLTARRAGLSVAGLREGDGTYLFSGLPEGRVHVIGTAWSDDAEARMLSGEIDASAGEEVSLTLR